MMTCLLDGQLIAAVDVRNRYGQRNIEIEERYRLASQQGRLICADCNRPVRLRAGDIRIPHFAHEPGTKGECDYSLRAKAETEEHRSGKEFLYHAFREWHPEATVRLDHRHPSGERSDVLVEKDGFKLAVEYLRRDMTTLTWSKRHNSFVEQRIKDLWILDRTQYGEFQHNSSYFLDLMLSKTPSQTALLLDVAEQKIALLRYLEYRDDEKVVRERKPFVRAYSLSQINIAPSGVVSAPGFNKAFQQAQADYVRRLKPLYQRPLTPPRKVWGPKRPNEAVCTACGQVVSTWSQYGPKEGTCVCHECAPYSALRTVDGELRWVRRGW